MKRLTVVALLAACVACTGETFETDTMKPFRMYKPIPAWLASEKRGFQACPGITASKGGRLWAVWMVGAKTEDDTNAALVSTSGDGGATWSAPLFAIDAPGPMRVLDPGIWTDPDGTVWLFWGQTYDFWDGRCGLWAVKAADGDDPATEWSEPVRLCDGYMKNKPTVLGNGDWLFPVEFFSGFEPRTGNMNEAHKRPGNPFAHPREQYRRFCNTFVSRDKGKSLQFLGQVLVPDDVRCFSEHMYVERRDGTLWMPLRVKGGIAESTSGDGGRTWTPPVHAGLQAPNSRFFVRRLASGALLLVKNGREVRGAPGKAYCPRREMTAFVSDDDGRTWTGGLLLDGRDNVSYPDGVQTADGLIHVVHDCERQGKREIVHHAFSEADVRAGQLATKGSRLGDVVNRISPGREKVAMICAHPDDLPGCAGTAFLLREKFELHVIDFTHGELGGGGAAGRTKEEERACALLGAHLHWLSNVDGSAFASKEACEELEGVLAEIRPRAVITHWPIETHPDHVMATAAFFRVWRRPRLLRGFDPEVYFQDQCNQSRAFVPVHYVDIRKVLDLKEKLILQYERQDAKSMAARKRKDCELRGWRLSQLEGGLPVAEVFAEWPRDRATSRCIFSDL